ncbi:MAG: hypothetical protein CL607_14900 [Anaerolineaceae bacterium]|nr:hypothetical protein [Anaerolineaceae bacterium]
MTKQKELQVTPASQWARPTELVELPTGRVARFKRVNFMTMVRRGEDVPNFLKAYVAKSLRGETNKEGFSLDDLDPVEAVEFVIFMTKAVFDEPKVVEGDPQHPGEVSIEDIDPDEMGIAAAYGIGRGEDVQAMETFRQAARANVEPVPAVAGVGDESKPDPGA